MTALPWVRLDSNLPTHDKTLWLLSHGARGYRGVAVYAMGLAYCGGNGTDGLITFHALPVVHGTKADAALLVEAELWVPDREGWRVRNWRERQPSAEQVDAVRESRRRAGAAGACKRWHDQPCDACQDG